MLAADQTPIRLITLDPGHFHASLVQKEMYPGVSPRVTVYAPLGFDLTEHLNRVARFNLRPDKPTHWELDIHTSDDPLAQMLRERPGNVVVIAGRNRPKIDRIQASVNAGLNVLSDKPWVIRSADLPKVAATLDAAEKKGLVAYDLMTERYEATNYIQKELVDDPGVFGMIVPGDAQNPGVYMESIHWLLKTVDGAPLLRPVWFFDTNEQGEGLSDVGTHLVDLAAWTLFPQTILDYREDVKMEAAERFPTPMTAAEYKKVTGAAYTSADGVFNYYCNTKVQYALRGVHIKLDVLWKYQNPTNGPDTLVAVYRGTRSRVEVREGEVYVIPVNAADKVAILNAASKRLAHYGDVKATDAGDRIKLNIPSRLRVGHEAHFAQVAAKFFEYLKNPASMPVWEKANMLAKYYVTTMGVDMSQQSKH